MGMSDDLSNWGIFIGKDYDSVGIIEIIKVKLYIKDIEELLNFY
jgi:predicted RNA-binding protein with RPS1 domain